MALKKRNNRSRGLAAVLLSGLLLAALPLTAFAEEGDELVLQDNVLAYSELGAAIRSGSPEYTQSMDSLNATIAMYQRAEDELRFEAGIAYSDGKDGEKEARKLSGEDRSGVSEAAMEDYMEATTDRMSADMYNDRIKSLTSWSGMASYRQLERRLTAAAEQTMISYETLKLQKEAAEKSAELYSEKQRIMEMKRTAGAATDADVTGAQNQYLSAAVSLSQAEDSLSETYTELCRSVGRAADGSLTIADIPAPTAEELSAIDDINLETDTAKAIGNNSTLISQRHQNKEDQLKSTPYRNYLERTTESGEADLTETMRQLYEDLYAKRDALNTAEIKRAAAERQFQDANLKYSAGMLDRAGYLDAELAKLNADTAVRSAELSMVQAISTYNWAVAGQVSVSLPTSGGGR